MKVVVSFAGWAGAAATLLGLGQRWKKAMQKALMQEGQLLRANVVKNINSGGTYAGKPFKPLSAATIAIRKFKGQGGGTKPLIQTGALRNSISVVRTGGTAVFVSVKRKVGNLNLAALHEFGGGPWTRPMTTKQRRFLMAAFAASGLQGGGGGGGGGMITIRIPARPYFGPTAKKFHKPNQTAKRVLASIASTIGGALGKP